MVKVINMPGKRFKSIGIREKLYNRIEEEKKEEESISDYIERTIDTAKEKEEVRKDEQGKEGLSIDQIKNAVKEVLNEKKEVTTDPNAGITIEDLKRELIKVEVETVDKIKAKIEELKYV